MIHPGPSENPCPSLAPAPRRGSVADAVRAFLAFVMYAGAALSVLAFFLPGMDNRIGGVEVPPDVARLLPWIALGMVLVGYFGRRILRPSDDVEWR